MTTESESHKKENKENYYSYIFAFQLSLWILDFIGLLYLVRTLEKEKVSEYQFPL